MMQVGFHAGDSYINSADKVYTIAHLSETSVFFEGDTPTDMPLALPIDEFKAQIKQQEFQHLLDISTEVDTLTKYQQRHFDRRQPYLSTLQDMELAGLKPTAKNTYEKVCEVVQREHHICKHPGFSTLCKWWHAFKTANECINQSLPKDPIQPKRLDDESENKMKRYVANTFLKASQRNINRAYKQYEDYIDEAKDEQIRKVSESTFRRRLNELNKYDKLLGSENFNQIRRAQRTFLSSIPVERALERVEMDRVHLNLAVIDDETGKAIGPVSIYAAIDCYSRYPIGFLIEYGQAEDSRGTVNLLKQMLIPVSDELNACGLPETIIGDNGTGFISQKMNQISESLKVEYIRTASGQPWKKPFVESFFNTLRREYLDGTSSKNSKGELRLGVPGYIGKRTYKNNQYLDEGRTLKAARIKASEFERSLNDFLIHFVNSEHGELNGVSPKEKWEESIRRDGIVQPTYDELSHHFRVMEESRTLFQRGYLNLNHQKYSSRDLKAVYDLIAVGNNNTKDPQVIVKYDPDDIRHATVNYIDPRTNKASAIIVPNVKYGSLEKPISFEEVSDDKKRHSRPLFKAHFTITKPKSKPPKKDKEKKNALKFHEASSLEDYVKKSNEKKPLTTKQKTDPSMQDTTSVKEKKTSPQGTQVDFIEDCYDDTDWKDND